MIDLCCIFFFFSSRRRHTRYIGDWSSDVCSSDLSAKLADFGLARAEVGTQTLTATGDVIGTPSYLRSEERRVGKGVDMVCLRIIVKNKKKKNKTTMTISYQNNNMH